MMLIRKWHIFMKRYRETGDWRPENGEERHREQVDRINESRYYQYWT